MEEAHKAFEGLFDSRHTERMEGTLYGDCYKDPDMQSAWTYFYAGWVAREKTQ